MSNGETTRSEKTKSGPIRYVFVMAGAAPRTEWLEDSFVLDHRDSSFTGPDLAEFAAGHQWLLKRAPLMLETSVPGIFCCRRHTSRKCETGCLRSRRRFNGSFTWCIDFLPSAQTNKLRLNKRKWPRLRSQSYRITVRTPLQHKHVIERRSLQTLSSQKN